MITKDLGFIEYCRLPEINGSLLTHATESWKQFRYVQQHGYQPKVDTRVGTALHSFVELLPVREFEEQFALMPDFKKHPDNVTANGNASTSRTAWVEKQEEQFKAENEGNILPRSDFYRCLRMLKSVEENAEAMELIENSEKELTVRGDICGVPCKGRQDGLTNDYRVLWDLKSSSSIEPHQFGRTAANLNYLLKLAMYWRLLAVNGIEPVEVKLIAVLDVKPHHKTGEYNRAADCAVVNVPMVAIENQMPKLERLLSDYKACQRNDHWPGVGNHELVIPNWSMEWDLVD